jgi:hypothetical protein
LAAQARVRAAAVAGGGTRREQEHDSGRTADGCHTLCPTHDRFSFREVESAPLGSTEPYFVLRVKNRVSPPPVRASWLLLIEAVLIFASAAKYRASVRLRLGSVHAISVRIPTVMVMGPVVAVLDRAP